MFEMIIEVKRIHEVEKKKENKIVSLIEENSSIEQVEENNTFIGNVTPAIIFSDSEEQDSCGNFNEKYNIR